MASTVRAAVHGEPPMRDGPQRMRVEWLMPEALPVLGDRIESRDGRGYWLVRHVAPLLGAAGCDPARPWLFLIASRHVGQPPDGDDGALFSWDCTRTPGLLATVNAGKPKKRQRAGTWKPGTQATVFM